MKGLEATSSYGRPGGKKDREHGVRQRVAFRTGSRIRKEKNGKERERKAILRCPIESPAQIPKQKRQKEKSISATNGIAEPGEGSDHLWETRTLEKGTRPREETDQENNVGKPCLDYKTRKQPTG